MKELIIIICVFVGLAILVQIAYVVLMFFVDKHYWEKVERSVGVIHVYGPDEHFEPYIKVCNGKDESDDPFDLGVEVDKIRFGDEE